MAHWLSVFLILGICGPSWARGLTTWDRQKRETESDKPTGCIYYKFQCSDEACIETARNSLSSLVCPPIHFECAMASNGKHDCRGRSICVDNSGELLPKCPPLEEVYPPVGNCGEAEFQGKNEKCTNEEELCNGKRDCTDGSDELEEICSHHFCPSNAFRCAYGGCVPGNVSCNGVIDCRDGSDEADSLCRRATPSANGTLSRYSADRPPGSCAIPAIENGRVVSQVKNEIYSFDQFAVNGERLRFVCLDGPLEGANETYCINGSFTWEPPRCKINSECGKIVDAMPLIFGGNETTISSVPWHVGVYELQKGKYAQICGGTIISQTAILTAAHCFWKENSKSKTDANLLAIVAGKTSRDYYVKDPGMQIFQVTEIHIPNGYRGGYSLYSADIAVARLKTSIIYQAFISPICIPYYDHESDHSVPHGTKGRVAGWGLNENGVGSPVLKVIDLEAIDFNTSSTNAPESFTPYILNDKFCAFLLTESVCQGDSGGGFAEAVNHRGVVKYYLRGLVSVGSSLNRMNVCQANGTYVGFTNILSYASWINKYTKD